MTIKDIVPEEKKEFDEIVGHPLQAYDWGEFREKTGVKVIRRGFFQPEADRPLADEDNKLISAFQLTIHKIPKTPWTIGYLPKGDTPTNELVEELKKIGKENNCIFIQLEPNVILSEAKNLKDPSAKPQDDRFKNLGLKPAAHPLFTRYTFVLDLTKSEEQILAGMHSKARYNIRVAQKHNVTVDEDNSDEAFAEYLRLTRETTTRQKFYAHSEKYHRIQWETLPHKKNNNQLSSHLLIARHNGKVLTTWILFVFKDTLYYPYGASSSENREVMSSNLMMWEAIRFGKKLGLKKFDMWGALGANPNPKDPWFGFHNFKEKYGPEHVEFVGSYDLVINPVLYHFYNIADKLRWIFLKIKR